MTARELEQLKQQIEQARTDRDQTQGAITQLMKQLKEEFGCKTVEEAREKLKELQKELDTLSEKMDKKTAELERMVSERNTASSPRG